MKNRTNILFTGTLLICLVLFTGCLDNFLEADPQGKYTSQNFFKVNKMRSMLSHLFIQSC